jgi:hypothetical protein
MALSEQGLTEDQVLQKVYDLLRTRDPTFPARIPLSIPKTDYVFLGGRFEAFFKLSSGSIANMVIFLEAAHRTVIIDDKPIQETLIELIENQLALPDKLKTQPQVYSKDRRKYLQQANMLLSKLKSLPR